MTGPSTRYSHCTHWVGESVIVERCCACDQAFSTVEAAMDDPAGCPGEPTGRAGSQQVTDGDR